GEGGEKEDKPGIPIPPWEYGRSINHFHDPLTNKGWFNIGGTAFIGDSSIIWSQKPRGKQYFGEYSWHDVRYYFYKALTLQVKENRDDNFAEMFRGLGQLMHLVEDASVPDHTRNDTHVTGYELWVDNKKESDPDSGIFKIAGVTIDLITKKTNFFSPVKLLEAEGGFPNATNPF
ncbi:MAG: hypothetical protein C0403_20095, partial [Desulfobacterium sp.]|nr:hypothetical protein [Desulfobacterium sp.]